MWMYFPNFSTLTILLQILSTIKKVVLKPMETQSLSMITSQEGLGPDLSMEPGGQKIKYNGEIGLVT